MEEKEEEKLKKLAQYLQEQFPDAIYFNLVFPDFNFYLYDSKQTKRIYERLQIDLADWRVKIMEMAAKNN